MKNLLTRFARDESGATATEYALIGGVVSVAILGGTITLAGALDDTYQGLADDNF